MAAAQTVLRLAFAEILQNDGNLLRLKMTAAHFYRFLYQRQVKKKKQQRMKKGEWLKIYFKLRRWRISNTDSYCIR